VEIVQKGQLSADEGGEEGSKELVMVIVMMMMMLSSFVRAFGAGERIWACAQDGGIALWRGQSC
jgi:hypothetical protein